MSSWPVGRQRPGLIDLDGIAISRGGSKPIMSLDFFWHDEISPVRQTLQGQMLGQCLE